MKATITGIDKLSKRILLDLNRGYKVSEIPEMYPVSLDQTKRLSRYLKILNQAEDYLTVDVLLKVELLGLKILPLAKLFKNEDWQGISEILSVVTDETTREDLQGLIRDLEEKRNRMQDFKVNVSDQLQLLEEKEKDLLLLVSSLEKEETDIQLLHNQLKEIRKEIIHIKKTAPQSYMSNFATIPLLSIEELKIRVDLKSRVNKWLYDDGYVVVNDFILPNEQKCDVFAYDSDGRIMIVNVRVTVADLYRDRAWKLYFAYCDAFYFLTPERLCEDLNQLDDKVGHLMDSIFGIQMRREDDMLHSLDSKERTDLIFNAARKLSKGYFVI